jgi:hypothetical protein
MSSALSWHFHQLLIIVEGLWSEPILQVGKQVVDAWNENRAVLKVVEQLPDEMLEQCSNGSSLIWAQIAIQEHYTGYQHSTPYI